MSKTKGLANMYIYRNLHADCYSIRYKDYVIAHARELVLYNVTFKVSEKGRQRVLHEKRKNVHAYALTTFVDSAYGLDFTGNYNLGEGILDDVELLQDKLDPLSNQAWYNPYKVETFVDGTTFEPITKARQVHLHDSGIVTYTPFPSK